ncbi:MAG TPA: HAD family phosphatase [Anaerolineales bacterium]|nr:HAD family phosphatase [Anaerolineales bacterium]
MTIKAIIWDVGGVLERTLDFGPRAALAARFGWDMNDLMDLFFGKRDDYRIQLGKVSRKAHLENIAQALGVPDTEIPKIWGGFFAGDKLDYALVDEIRTLKAHYTTAILSNYGKILRKQVEQEWQIGDAFDHLIISAEVGVMKPDPAIFQIALEKIGCQPQEAVFLDDVLENIKAAQAVGLHAIWFKSPEQALAELHNLLNMN